MDRTEFVRTATRRTIMRKFARSFASISLASMAAFIVLAVATESHASADDGTTTYQVKYDEVGSTCTDTGMSLRTGTLTIKNLKTVLEVEIERIPVMTGKVSKSSRIKASSRLGPTTIQGLDGKFSVAGKVDDGVLQLLFIAEYYVNKKARCMQSWNISGLTVAELDK